MSKPFIWCATVVAAAIDLGGTFAATIAMVTIPTTHTAMVLATTDMGPESRSVSAAAIISAMALEVTALAVMAAVITDELVVLRSAQTADLPLSEG